MSRTKLDRTAERIARVARVRLAEDIDRLCADAGLSHAALAQGSGVSTSHFGRLMAGTTKPSLETYARIAAGLGADFGARLYPNTGPAIRDRLSVPILEALLETLHPHWSPFAEVRVFRPGRGWIDAVLLDRRAELLVATEIETTLNRIEQMIRWTGQKADSLPSWERWSELEPSPAISRLLIVRWTRATREAADAAERQLRIAFPAHPDDALASLTGIVPWPGPALLWARTHGSSVRFVGRR